MSTDETILQAQSRLHRSPKVIVKPFEITLEEIDRRIKLTMLAERQLTDSPDEVAHQGKE